MPPPDDDAAYLHDMLSYARRLVAMTSGVSVGEFTANVVLRFAVERVIEIIGESARHVSDEFQRAHPEVPWQKIVAQRHVLAHEYGAIDAEKIWRVATIHVPELVTILEPLVPPAPRD